MTFKETKRFCNALSEIRVKCPCSHTMYFPSYGPDIQVCSHCGRNVYRNDKVKFIHTLSKKIKTLEVNRCQF